MKDWIYLKSIETAEQFEVGKYYAILDITSFEETDFFLCNNIEASAKKIEFYKGRCAIVRRFTDDEIRRAIEDLHHRNSEEYWKFVRAAHSKSKAPLEKCVELQRERAALETLLWHRNAKRDKSYITNVCPFCGSEVRRPWEKCNGFCKCGAKYYHEDKIWVDRKINAT